MAAFAPARRSLLVPADVGVRQRQVREHEVEVAQPARPDVRGGHREIRGELPPQRDVVVVVARRLVVGLQKRLAEVRALPPVHALDQRVLRDQSDGVAANALPLALAAVALAAVNVFGGFLVTRRMLEMFRKKK